MLSVPKYGHDGITKHNIASIDNINKLKFECN